jgi:N-acyl-D-aspartate/D-glutamate deacylase
MLDLVIRNGTLIGGSDAGAHLDMIDTFAVPTPVLQKSVREHGLLSLEQAVHQLGFAGALLRPAPARPD